MTESRVDWAIRIFIALGLLFLIFTLLLFLLEFGYGGSFIAYMFYALTTIGIVLALVKYFQSERAGRRGQITGAIRFFVGLALILLVLTIPFLLLDNTSGADFTANLSYVFLVVGVFLALVEYFQGEWGESKRKV